MCNDRHLDLVMFNKKGNLLFILNPYILYSLPANRLSLAPASRIHPMFIRTSFVVHSILQDRVNYASTTNQLRVKQGGA